MLTNNKLKGVGLTSIPYCVFWSVDYLEQFLKRHLDPFQKSILVTSWIWWNYVQRLRRMLRQKEKTKTLEFVKN